MIRFEHVTKVYEDNQVRAVTDISFQMERGGFLFLTGESGSGKSTILRLIVKDIEPTQGEIWVNGKYISQISRKKVPGYRQRIGIIFQDFCLLQDKNVYQNVAIALLLAGNSGYGMDRQVTSVLSLLGLAGKFKSYPSELSGGEQQKVCLARAIVNHPAILLADEPTGNLDPKNSQEIMGILDLLHKRGTTVLVATHDRQCIEQMGYPLLSLTNL